VPLNFVPNSNLSTFLLKKVSSSSLQTFEQNDEYSYKINILNKPQASGNQQQSAIDAQRGSNEQSQGSINVLADKAPKRQQLPNTLFSEVIIEDENDKEVDTQITKSYNSRLSSQNHNGKQSKNRNFALPLAGGMLNNPLARKSYGDNFAH
jgi:hypothetical protein